MARIIYCHPSQTPHGFHIFSDLDFWDARRLLKGLATVKRNFGQHVSGDTFPTQVTGDYLSGSTIRRIERRIKQAIVSPARHVIVRSMIFEGYYEFDPKDFYPEHWTRGLMMHFTYHRLPLNQGVLNNPYQEVRLTWVDDRIRVDRVQRSEKWDPVIRTPGEARKRLIAPACF
jgi:hypothetical protein